MTIDRPRGVYLYQLNEALMVQAITLTYEDELPIGPLQKNFSAIGIKI